MQDVLTKNHKNQTLFWFITFLKESLLPRHQWLRKSLLPIDTDDWESHSCLDTDDWGSHSCLDTNDWGSHSCLDTNDWGCHSCQAGLTQALVRSCKVDCQFLNDQHYDKKRSAGGGHYSMVAKKDTFAFFAFSFPNRIFMTHIGFSHLKSDFHTFPNRIFTPQIGF